MEIRVKLMGVLKDKTPPGEKIDLPAGATIADALGVLTIPTESVQVLTINGSLERDQSRALEDEDELSVIPPVGGGA